MKPLIAMLCLLPHLLYADAARLASVPQRNIEAPVVDTNAMFPADRHLMSWTGHVGVRGGIPDSSAMTVYTNLATNVSLATFNAAIAACPSNQVIQLTNGVYTLNGLISVQKDGVVIRGNGKTNTFIELGTSGGFDIHGGDTIYNIIAGVADAPNVTSWTAGFTSGTTNITLSNATGLAVGDVIGLDAKDDEVVISNSGSQGELDKGRLSADGGWRHALEFHRVESIDGNTVTIDPPIFFNYFTNTANAPQAWWMNSEGHWRRRVGLESMALWATNTDGEGFSYPAAAYLNGGYECWMKDVAIHQAQLTSNSPPCDGIVVYSGFRNEFRGCDLFGSPAESLGYAIAPLYNTATWIDDCLLQGYSGGIVPGWASGPMAITYCAMLSTVRFKSDQAAQPIINSHDAHSHSWLIEGNYFNCFMSDTIHGSGSHKLLFRNRMTGTATNYTDPPGLQGTSPEFPPDNVQLYYGQTQNAVLILQNTNTYTTMVGNVLGLVTNGVPIHSQYDAIATETNFTLHWIGWENSSQTWGNGRQDYQDLVRQTLFRHRNYDTVNAGTINSNGYNTTLTNSLIYTSKPSYFGDRTWPPWDVANGAALVANATAYTNLPAGYRSKYGVNPPP